MNSDVRPSTGQSLPYGSSGWTGALLGSALLRRSSESARFQLSQVYGGVYLAHHGS